MVRVYYATSLMLAAAVASVVAGEPRGMSLQLHRLPNIERHHDTYQRRRLKGIDDVFESVPLNPGMGTHYAWVYAGTPPQRASVITDTGSSLMAFPCSGCNGCGDHTDQPFSAANSSTLTHVTCAQSTFFRCEGCSKTDTKTCDISQSYMEGSSWRATVVEDVVYLGGEASFKDTEMRNTYGTHFMFGCQSRETGLFITQVADGIMGLSNNDNHIVAKLYKEKKIPNKLFTLCFAPNGGSMAIGAPDVTRHKGEIKYAPLLPASFHDFYAVDLQDVRIAGTSIEAPQHLFKSGQYIVDSGTTDSYLPSSMRQYIAAAFKNVSGFDYETSSSSCEGYTDVDLGKLPNFEFVLGGENGTNLTLVVTPDQYLLQESSGKYCSSIFASEASGGVIGANIMMGHDVIFDQEHQRVGFVKADCDYVRTSNSSGVPPVKDGADNSTVTAAPEPVVTLAVETSTPTPSEASTPEKVTPHPSKSAHTDAQVPTSTTTEPDTEVSDDEPPEPVETLAVEPTQPPATKAPATKTEAPTSKTPTAASGTSGVLNGTQTASNSSSQTDDDHPALLTAVGTTLAVAFIVVAAFSLRRHKKSSKDSKWSRVKENEEENDDDDDDEEELIVHTTSGRSKTKSDQFDSDEDSDDNNPFKGGRVADESDDDEEDDEIFEREAEEDDRHKHDAKVLERL